MRELQVFQNSEFGELGVLDIDGKPYFPATACAKKLGYGNPKDAIKRHCRWGVKHDLPHPQSPGKTLPMNFIPEGDLYRLITHSKLPSAERFESWVFDEVLPEIRKSGSYGAEEAKPDMIEIIQQTATAVCAEMVKQLFPIFQAMTGIPDPVNMPENKARFRAEQSLYEQASYYSPTYEHNPCQCKLDQFPEELKKQVDEMLRQMIKQQKLNLSHIARYCTLNGYTISSPSVKRYFERHFRI